MEKSLQFSVIKKLSQYKQYCQVLEECATRKRKSALDLEIIELLTLLIEKWDADHRTLTDSDPVQLLNYLMKENKIRAIDLSVLLNVSKTLISDILHYRRGFSKEIIRKLSERFKVSQEAFNRPYKLSLPESANRKNASLKKKHKRLSKITVQGY